MKRFLLLVILAAAAAFAISYGLRRAAMTPHVAVATLLPQETLFFAQMPDFNRTRDQWHESDIYQLYREPAVQEFLQKPLTKLPRRDAVSETIREIENLDPKDAFISVVSIEENIPKVLAGFRFRGSREEAEKVIGQWCRQSLNLGPNTPHQTIEYAEHQIEILTIGPNQLLTVYDGDWFLASNDLEQLKALLDRVDHRPIATASPTGSRQDRQSTLEADQNFRAAVAHMPSSYALLFYVQPKTIAAKLESLEAKAGQQIPPEQRAGLWQMRSICGAMRFNKGKIHDVWFLGMPKLQNEKLMRSAVDLGTTDTFFYLATLLNPQSFDAIKQAGANAPFSGWLQKFLQATAQSGITSDDWKAAFDLELGSLADWPAGARWPSLIAALPVKDSARAEKIVNAFTFAIDEDGPWKRTENEGVRYFSLPSAASLVAITPTIALSSRILIAGLDPSSVEGAMKRSASSASVLARTQNYKSAARLLPEPTNLFAYIDTQLMYSRLDASLRPMLLLAALLPGISDHVDISKVPPPEVVTRHLSPIVFSQRYDGEGYVAESIGPITFNQAVIVVGVPAALWIFRSSGAALEH
jgi:hypothetical protein